MKRRAERQLTADDSSAGEDEPYSGPVATAEELRNRRKLRVKRSAASATDQNAKAEFKTSGLFQNLANPAKEGNLPASSFAQLPTSGFKPTPPPEGKKEEQVAAPKEGGKEEQKSKEAGESPAKTDEKSPFGSAKKGDGATEALTSKPIPSVFGGAGFNFSFTSTLGSGSMVEISKKVTAEMEEGKKAPQVDLGSAAVEQKPAASFADAPVIVARPVEESDSDTELKATLKLFDLDTSSTEGGAKWKERGCGHLKIKKNESDQKVKARMCMWHGQTKKELLNVNISSTLKVSNKTEKSITFVHPGEDGVPRTSLLMSAKDTKAPKETFENIVAIIEKYQKGEEK